MAEEQFRIPIDPSTVHFLQTPKQFYEELLTRISTSKKRVLLAALYLGTGAKEAEIVASLEAAFNRKNGELRVGILLDYFRGSRGGQSNSSVAMLRPLAAANENVQVSFFHTPEMRGFWRLLPWRLKEAIGLQHMKFFIFDDSILISGANLSEQYFDNRQDRYLLIEDSPILADFFQSLFDIISKYSFQLDSYGQLSFKGQQSLHPCTGPKPEIQASMRRDIEELYQKLKERLCTLDPSNGGGAGKSAKSDTFVQPFLQMGCFNIDQESQLFKKLLDNQQEKGKVELTLMTAYFNLYDAYADLILSRSPYPIKIVFGSPQTNGFFGASGLAGYIPHLYVQSSLDFMQKVICSGRTVSFMEWNRPDWTFHAKGLWVDSLEAKKISTVVGSSNFGYRSARKDLEAQLLLVTSNEMLKKRINEERNYLLEYAEWLDASVFLRRDHLIPFWVKPFLRFFRKWF